MALEYNRERALAAREGGLRFIRPIVHRTINRWNFWGRSVLKFKDHWDRHSNPDRKKKYIYIGRAELPHVQK